MFGTADAFAMKDYLCGITAQPPNRDTKNSYWGHSIR